MGCDGLCILCTRNISSCTDKSLDQIDRKARCWCWCRCCQAKKLTVLLKALVLGTRLSKGMQSRKLDVTPYHSACHK
ncbi:hypothetical protein OIU79_004301 [Salix purpurea]|uniref:Uncharacterized protein n=1 Tax=Salix purpurea TaxID=77065 RepID=A0A9Q0UA12_SALPP|nr:hypothetical protein OIU79_004301 [Salix purpurea]